MADFDVGTLKGSIKIDYSSITKAESAIQSFQKKMASYESAAAKIARSNSNVSSSNVSLRKNIESLYISEEKRQRALTQLTAAEKQVLVLRRQAAAETKLGIAALEEANQKIAAYRQLLQNTNITQASLTRSYEEMQRALIRASVATTGLNQATANTRTWFRTSRAAAAQMGMQLQDIAIQAQMGTNALVIFGQQGSQILSLFGAGGALLGALVAVGAAVANFALGVNSAEKASDNLDKTLQTLDSTFRKTSEGASILSEEILKYAKVSESAARIELQKRLLDSNMAVQESISAIGNSIDDVINYFVEFSKTIEKYGGVAEALVAESQALGDEFQLFNYYAGASTDVIGLTNLLERASRELGITRDQTEQLMIAFNNIRANRTEESLKNFIDVLARIQFESNNASESFIKLSATLNKYAVDTVNAIRKGEEIEKVLNNLGVAIDEATQSEKSYSSTRRSAIREIQDYIDKLRKQAETFGMSEEELVKYEIRTIAAKDATIQNVEALENQALAYLEQINIAKQRQKQIEEEEKALNAINSVIGQINDLRRNTDQQRRLNAALEQGADAHKAVKDQIELENAALKVRNTLMRAGVQDEAIINGIVKAYEEEYKKLQEVKNAQDNVNSSMKEGEVFAKQLGAAISTSLENAIVEMEGFSKLLESVLKDILRIVVRTQITQPLGEAISQIDFGSLFPNAKGNVFSGGRIVPFASGGIVTSPTFFPMSNGNTGLMGEAGYEAIMPLTRTPDGKLGVEARGSGTIVQIIDQRNSGAAPQVERTSGPDGRQIIRVLIREEMKSAISDGSLDRAIANTYGLRRRVY